MLVKHEPCIDTFRNLMTCRSLTICIATESNIQTIGHQVNIYYVIEIITLLDDMFMAYMLRSGCLG